MSVLVYITPEKNLSCNRWGNKQRKQPPPDQKENKGGRPVKYERRHRKGLGNSALSKGPAAKKILPKLRHFSDTDKKKGKVTGEAGELTLSKNLEIRNLPSEKQSKKLVDGS